MTLAASRKALDAFCSPSAAMTCQESRKTRELFPIYRRLALALASLAASASAAIARCN